MKLNSKLFLPILLSFFVFITAISCTKETQDKTSYETMPVFNSATNSKLTFSSITELEETINMLLLMDEESRQKWYTAKGFTSAEQVLIKAESELSSIKSIEDVNNYKQRYSKHFIFDNNDVDVNANPFLKIKKFGYSYVCNIDGDVIINGKVCNYNQLASYEETDDYKNTIITTKNVDINKVTRIEDKRKFWAEVKRVGDNVYIEFYARKKVMFSWSDYNTNYTISHKYDNGSWVYVNQTNPASFGLLWLIGSRGIPEGSKYAHNTVEVKGRYTMFFDTRVYSVLDPNTGMIVYPDAIAEVYVSCRSGLNGVLGVYPNYIN